MKKNVAVLLLICFVFAMLSSFSVSLALSETEESVLTENSSEISEEENETEEEAESEAVDTITNADGLEIADIHAEKAVLADFDSGKILFSKNADKAAEPASLTKIMTALIAIEAIEAGTVSLDDEVEAYDDCMTGLDEESSNSNISPGEVLSLEDLLYCAVLASAGEACNIIGEYIGGSIDAFVNQMNSRAEALGCSGTHFVNTHGMPSEDHYTTAADMYLISREAASHELFMTICNTLSYTVASTNKSGQRTLDNTNALLTAQGIYGGKYVYEYASGIKTGHTSAAGYCLASTAEKDGVHLICIVLGSDTSSNEDGSTSFHNFSDSIDLYDWAFSNYQYYTVCTESDLITEVTVKYAPSDESLLTLHPAEDVTALLPNTTDPNGFTREVTLTDESPAAPIEAGDVLGSVDILYNSETIGSAELLASSSVELSRWEYMKAQIRDLFGHTWVMVLFLVILLLVLTYIILVLRYKRIRREQLRKKREQQRQRIQQKEQEAANKMFYNDSTKMYDYDSEGHRTDGYADKHDYFDKFFKEENRKGKNK